MEKRRRGQGLVEFALVLPVLLLLMFAIVDFGYAFLAYSSLFNAAREGARYGITQPRDKVGITYRTREQMFLIDRNATSISIEYDNASSGVFTDTGQVEVGDRISVIVSHDLPMLTPLVQQIVPSLHMDTTARRTIASLGDTVSSADFDGDGVPDNQDGCPSDPNKTSPGDCGCGVPDVDSDGDGYYDSPCGDCDSADPDVNPGADEVCSGGVDDDCDGAVDCDDSDCGVDGDGDTYGSEPCGSDCDDADPGVNPGASEITCNDKDDDCNPSTLDKPDEDGDNYTVCDNDCDDSDPDVNPGEDEICTGGDDEDCDDDVDCQDADCAGDPACVDVETSCDDDIDNDDDGKIDCADDDCVHNVDEDGANAPPCGADCDDGNAAIYPGATETCNGVDDDCDDVVDEPGADGCTQHYKDADDDGYGVDGDTQCLCDAQGDYTATRGGDCNDGNDAIHPGALESCNGVDDNCDNVVDEEDAAGCTTYWKDGDDDGYGVDGDTQCLCEPDGDYAATQGEDCDDTAPAINPDGEEVCDDGDDNDCDGLTDCDDSGDCEGDPACVATMHVANLDADAQKNQPPSSWRATVYITVYDDGNNAVGGAEVTGEWTAGSPSSVSCTTNSVGQCSVAADDIGNNHKSVTFTVTGIEHNDYDYRPADNDETAIPVDKP